MFAVGWILLLATLFLGCGEAEPDKHENLASAKIFEPGVITRFDRWSFTPTFSKDMSTLVYVAWKDPLPPGRPNTVQELFVSRKVEGKWLRPKKVVETTGDRVSWPHFTPDGKYFLLSFTRPHEGHYRFPARKGWTDFDIWIAPTNDSGEVDWSDLRPLKGSDINRAKTPENRSIGYVHNETGPRMDLAGNLYFWTERLDDGGGRRDIYLARRKSGPGVQFEKARLLDAPINSRFKETGAAISPDGKWMIFSSQRPGGRGGADLYFARRLADRKWSRPVNLGKQTNSDSNEIAPEITPDGKTLFFTSNRPLDGVAPQSRGEGSRYNAIYSIPIASLEIDVQ